MKQKTAKNLACRCSAMKDKMRAFIKENVPEKGLDFTPNRECSDECRIIVCDHYDGYPKYIVVTWLGPYSLKGKDDYGNDEEKYSIDADVSLDGLYDIVNHLAYYTHTEVEDRIAKLLFMSPDSRRGIKDSLLLDSGTTVARAKFNDGRQVVIRVVGDVRLNWKNEIYKTPSAYPEDVVNAIRNHSKKLQIINSNWYEAFCYDENETLVDSNYIELDDLETLTESEIRSILNGIYQDIFEN